MADAPSMTKRPPENESFLLDTCVTSLILNGELWDRSPATLMGCRPDVYAAWRFAKEETKDAQKHHTELQKSIAAYEWAKDRVKRGSPHLYLSPTIQEELVHAEQVFISSTSYCHRRVYYS